MKTVNIKGKLYVPVSERIKEFNKLYPKGCIQTQLLSNEDTKKIRIKATVYPDATIQMRFFTGYAQEIEGKGYINADSAIENCETSAVGRALGMLGIGVLDDFASANEVINATTSKQPVNKYPASKYPAQRPVTKPRIKSVNVCTLCKAPITTPIAVFSLKKYRKKLCMSCQKLNAKKYDNKTVSKPIVKNAAKSAV